MNNAIKNSKKMRGMATKIAIILSFLVMQFYASCPIGTTLIGGVCRPNYLINNANILIAIFFAISGIIYMIGNVFASPKVIEYGKDLLKITLQNVFILFIIYFLFYWLDTVGNIFATSSLAYPGETYSRGFQGQGWNGMQNYVENYLKDMKEDLRNGLGFVFIIATFAGAVSTLSVNLDLTGLGMTAQLMVPVGSGVSSIVSFFSYAVTLMVTMMLNLELQYRIFTIIGRNIFPLLLPFGILLRTFPVTRGAGSALLAMAIGFGVFLPIAYLIDRDVGNKVCGSTHINKEEIFSNLRSGIENPSRFIDYLRSELQPGRYFWRIICKYGVEAFIIPFFAYIMILNLIRHLAEIMGTHIDLSTLVRII
jgi:hypothetical protein